MLHALFGDGRREAVAILFAGSLGLLLSVLLSVRRMAAEDSLSPSRRAIAHWLPIAIAAVVATVLGHPEIGMGIAFGTSVAALSTVVGFVAMAGPVGEPPPAAQRIWPFLPVPVLLAFLAGFHGMVGLYEAGLLLVQGILALMVWTSHDPPLPVAAAPAGPQAPPTPPPPAKLGWIIPEMILALALAAISAWAATRGAEQLHNIDWRYPTSVLAATLISAVLVLPMVSTGVPLSVKGQGWVPVTAQAGVVLLNMGLLLPAVVLVCVGRQFPGLLQHLQAGGRLASFAWDPVLYSRISWRIDAVALLIFSLLFVPAAAGKVRFTRGLATWLILGYCLYMISVLGLGARP